MAGVLVHHIRQLDIPYPRTLGIVLVLFASLIAWSRVVVGVHWPVDVLVGAIWGWYSVKLILMIAARTEWIGHTRRSANILYTLAAISAIVLLDFNGGYPMAGILAKIIGIAALILLAIAMLERNYQVKLTIVLRNWNVRLQLLPQPIPATSATPLESGTDRH